MQKIWKIIIALVIVIIMVKGGIYLWQKNCEIKPQTSITKTEKEQMFSSAREYIAKYSVPGIEVSLEIIKQLDKWALLNAVPLNVETDEVGVIMEKVDNKWETRTFGTIFPEWEEKIPELFK
jgi:hypothetical protein